MADGDAKMQAGGSPVLAPDQSGAPSAGQFSFELDAGKILAKLHRGGCETHSGVKFFNTGIVNDENIKPEEVKKSKINFDMDGGEYQIGVVLEGD